MTIDTFVRDLREDLHAPPPRVRSRRQVVSRDRGRLAIGALVLAASGLLAAVVYANVGDRRPVLAVAATVDPGDVIKPSDLVVVRVATDADVKTVASSAKASLVGRRAAVRLLAGSLLTPGAINNGAPIAPGMAVIGALVKPGQYPAGLRAGDPVDVAVVGAAIGERPVSAVISSVTGSGGPGGTTVSLAVPAYIASRLAAAGAESRLLLMVPPR